MPDEPWESYHRHVLRSGLSYPVGRSIVEASLRAAGVHLLALDFHLNGDNRADTVLLRAVRYSEIGSTYGLARGTPNRPRCVLTLYAVPSEARAEARTALTNGNGLHRACAWLAAAEDAKPTWLDKSHSWTAYLHNDALRVEETED
ncbi:hypothetical protein ACPPVO_38660 [Dactylosporangium sp. McL0621]|uniref:hypothetical protein n=1 Tax=Dactylosporangium sp. McL0621 TaxID=3415678 RepID=UPI003CF4EA04